MFQDTPHEDRVMAQYVQLDSVNTWYDEHGSGDPLLLLHGALGTANGEVTVSGHQSRSRSGRPKRATSRGVVKPVTSAIRSSRSVSTSSTAAP